MRISLPCEPWPWLDPAAKGLHFEPDWFQYVSPDDNDNPRWTTDDFRMLYMKVWEAFACLPDARMQRVLSGLPRAGCMLAALMLLAAAPQVVPCCKRFVHDWSDCPFSHPGEKARRRDPKTHHYTGIACPDMKKVPCSRSLDHLCMVRVRQQAGCTGGAPGWGAALCNQQYRGSWELSGFWPDGC